MGYRASVGVDRRVGGVRYGCGRVQSQVVCRIPRPRLERIQRVRQQLVERSHRSPSTGFLKVSADLIMEHVRKDC